MDKQTQTCWDIIELFPFGKNIAEEGWMPLDMFVCLFELESQLMSSRSGSSGPDSTHISKSVQHTHREEKSFQSINNFSLSFFSWIILCIEFSNSRQNKELSLVCRIFLPSDTLANSTFKVQNYKWKLQIKKKKDCTNES